MSVGLLGCGRIARLFHLDLLSRMQGVDLRVIAETDPERRSQAGAIVKRSLVCDDYRRVLQDDTIEAVVICLPTGLHAEAACVAFRAGKHVYIEKPIATSEAEARQVLTAWRTSGRIGMTGFNQRFHPVLLSLKRDLAADRIGRVLGAWATMGAEARPLPEWKRFRSSGGGVLLDLASHVIDSVRFLFEREIRLVHATVSSLRTEDDTAALSMMLTDGRVAQIQVTLAGIQECRYEALGERGRLVADRYAGTVELVPARPLYGLTGHFRGEFRKLRSMGWRLRNGLRPAPAEPSYRRALATFIDAVTSSRSIAPDIEDGYRSLAVVLAAEASARAGRPVEVAIQER